MKRKKPIPGMRLLLCALLAAVALVGMTQRAEAYTDNTGGNIRINALKVSDEGDCQETWWEWKEDPNNKSRHRFRVYGPRGDADSSGGTQCTIGSKQNEEHTGALVFKNTGSLPGTLTIEYNYSCQAQGSSKFSFWLFPKKSDGEYSVDPGKDNITPNNDLADPKKDYSGMNPGDPSGTTTRRTVTAKLKAGEEARLVVWIRNLSNWQNPSRAYADIYISSVKFVAEGKDVSVTFQAPEINDKRYSPGTYTVSYDTTTNTMGKTSLDVTANIKSDTKVTLTAKPESTDNGDNNKYYVFRDWYDVTNGKTLSTSATFDAYFSDNTTITARYIDLYTTPLFEVDGQTFIDLNDAIANADKGNWKIVRLVKSGFINGGTYIIPNGVTLLLPYEKENKNIWNVNPGDWQTYPTKGKPDYLDCTDGKGAATNFESVKLTLKNTKLIVASGGAIEVGGMYGIRQGMHDGCFAPIYRYGWLKLESPNSSITVESGGKLYAWGYVTGSGTVTAMSGAELWELFQIMDWPGGSEARDKNDAFVFPISQYYVQNIEAELILQYGATEEVYAGVKAGGGFGFGSATLIGSKEGMFQMQSGAELRRKYNTTTDRIEYTVSNGAVSLSSIALDISVSGSSFSLNSSKFVLPINGNTTVNITEGATLNVTSDTSLLPGTQVYIHEGGTLAVADTARLYIYDRNQWNTYCFDNENQYALFQAVEFSPSMRGKDGVKTRPLNIRKETDLMDVKIDVNGTLKGNNIYTTGTSGTTESNGGANVCSSKGTGKYVREGNVGSGLLKQKEYKKDAVEIKITPIKLKNGSGATSAYTETGNAKVTYYYNKPSGTWDTQQVVNVTLNYNYTGAGTETIQSTEKLPAPTRTGYTFTGWNTKQDGTGTTYEAGATCSTLTEPTTLYAQWEAKKYTLVLNEFYGPTTDPLKKGLQLKKEDDKTISNNGTPLNFTVAYDDVIVLPQPTDFISVRDGSKFLGWKLMDTDGKVDRLCCAGAKIKISDDVARWYGSRIAFYAQWEREYYTVTASSALVTGDNIDSAELNNIKETVADVSLDGTGKYTPTETVTVIAPEKDGYTFQGWYGRYRLDGAAAKYLFSTELKASISLQTLADKCGMLKSGNVSNKDSSGEIQLFAVYTPKTETTNLTLKLDKAPADVEVSWDGTQKSGSSNEWEIPIGTEVTITVNDANFRYWTNANDKVMSRGSEYKFTMVTNTTLTAETSSDDTFVIFQSADERLLKYMTTNNLSENNIPDAPYRVGYTFKGWKVDGSTADATTNLETLKGNINSLSDKSNVVVTAEYTNANSGNFEVTATANVDGVTIEGSGKSYKLGDIATFEAPAASGNKTFRFWASDKDGTNILSFSQKYSFRVTKDTDIYAIYGGTSDKPNVQPVVRVDNVLAKEESNVKSLTFMIGASIPEGYQLVEMGALYTKEQDSGTDAQLRVENVNNDTVRKAVSRLNHETARDLADFSYALGFKIPDSSTNTTIHLRGYVAVRKTDSTDNTIYYYYSGITSKSYSDFNTQQGG